MVDKQKVEQAIRLLLEGIGEDTEREGLKDTPDRIARMCMEIYGGFPFRGAFLLRFSVSAW